MATRSIGASVAEGIESGFGLGLRADEAARRKKADARAEQDQLLQRERGDRAERRLDRQERISDLGERTKRLEARRGELVAASQAAQAAGGSVDPGAAAEFASVNKTLAQLRQEGENFFSRAATGQVDPLKASPEDLYTHLTAATGMTPAQIRQSTKHIADVTAGLQTSNEGLVIQGVNGLMQPQLNRGVGEASPHGGKILRKEVIGLDPAVDANMQPIPGKFMPRLRVYVQMPGMMTDKPLYYDAPMTVDGSSEGGAQVAVIDVKNGMNFMGNLGTLATAISRPDVLAKLEEGEKLAGARMKAALAELTAVSRPKAKGAAAERLDVIEAFARKNGIADLGEAAKRLQGMGVLANVGVLGQKLAAIDALDPDDPDYVLKRDVLLGGGGKTTGLIPQKPGKAGAAGSETMSSRYGKDPEYTKQVNYWAQLKANGGEWPARFSQIVGQEMASDVFKATAGIGVPNDQIANAAEVQGLKAGARAAGTRAANFGLAKSEAYKMADLVTQTSEKYGRTSFMPINKAINAFNTNTGDVEVRQFGAALNSFIQAYARAVSPVGVPTVSDKDHAREMLSAADSHAQVVGIIAQLKKEMEAAGEAPGVVRKQLRESALSLGADRDAAANKPAGSGKFTVGKTYVDGNGNKAVYQADGTWKAAP